MYLPGSEPPGSTRDWSLGQSAMQATCWWTSPENSLFLDGSGEYRSEGACLVSPAPCHWTPAWEHARKRDTSAFPNEILNRTQLDLLLGFQKRRLEFCSGISAGGEGGAGLTLAVFVWTRVSTCVASPSLTRKIHTQCFFSSHTSLPSDRAASEAVEMRSAAAWSR